MRTYSLDLRQRVLTALERGMSRHQVILTFGVSLATIKRWLILHRNAAPLVPKPSPGRRRTITVAQHDALSAQLEADPNATLADHTRRWNAAQGVQVRYRTLGRAIRRLG